MVATTKKVIETKTESKENLLTPRFYTTNFKEISELDVSSNKEEIEDDHRRPCQPPRPLNFLIIANCHCSQDDG
jgi:hypothetical protein